jgi:hypothetical protein
MTDAATPAAAGSNASRLVFGAALFLSALSLSLRSRWALRSITQII